MLIQESLRFYLYVIINLINGKLYIGYTDRNARVFRWNCHRSDLRRGVHPNTHLQRAWKKDEDREINFEFIPIHGAEYNTHVEVLAAEVAKIAELRAAGYDLYNATNGGEGCSLSGEAKERHREKMSQMKANPIWQMNHKAAMKDKWNDPLYRELMGNAIRNNWQNPGYVQLMAERGRNHFRNNVEIHRWQAGLLTNEEYDKWLVRVREGIERRNADPTWHQKNAAAARRSAADPNWQRQHRDQMKTLHAQPEYRQAHKEALTKLHADPAHKAMLSNMMHERWKTPSYGDTIVEGRRQAKAKRIADGTQEEFSRRYREKCLENQVKHKEQRGLELSKTLWTPDVLAQLGQMSDTKLAQVLGISTDIVQDKRRELKIQGHKYTQQFHLTTEQREQLGKHLDRVLAEKWNISRSRVAALRTALGIPAFRFRNTFAPLYTIQHPRKAY